MPVKELQFDSVKFVAGGEELVKLFNLLGASAVKGLMNKKMGRAIVAAHLEPGDYSCLLAVSWPHGSDLEIEIFLCRDEAARTAVKDKVIPSRIIKPFDIWDGDTAELADIVEGYRR